MTVRTNKISSINGGEEDLERRLRSIWLGMRDSNPRCQDQNLVPYHLANPQRLDLTGVL
jgi:hypothetical protein